jgi:hypothetical protein
VVNERLIHDAAVSMSQAILDTVQPCLRQEERLDALSEFYVICKAGIEAFCIQQERMRVRLNPTKN